MNATAYTAFQTFSWSLSGRQISVVSKPGLPNWDHLTAAESLAAEQISLPDIARVAVFNGRHGALTACLARNNPMATFTCLETNWIGVLCTRQTLAANQIVNAVVLTEPELPADVAGQLDAVILFIPKGRALSRRWLLESQAALKPGGALYIAGAKDAGIESVIKDAKLLFGEPEVLAYKKGERVVCLHQLPPAAAIPHWSLETDYTLTAPAFEPRLDGLHLISLPGVFSAGELDEGTALLLAHIPGLLAGLPAAAQVLDVGCGCGIIGLAAARLDRAVQVILLDSDLLAVASTRHNIASNHISNAQVWPSDLLGNLPEILTTTQAGKQDVKLGVQLILSNPPFHAGKETNYAITEALIEQAYNNLLPGGRLVLVANRFLTYQKNMTERFKSVNVLAQTSKFQVLSAER